MDSLIQLKEYFFSLVELQTDINEHLFTLFDYAKRSESACELGVRSGISTAALAFGLLRNGKPKQKLLSVDIVDCAKTNALQLANQCGLDAAFVQANSATIDLPEVDLLFIDSWHCFGHLRRELAKHHKQVRKWIILHDTNVYSRTSDSVRMECDLINLAEQSGYTIEEIYKGLSFAVDEFLKATPEWTTEIIHEHNHGLTILKRQHQLN